MKMHRRLVVVPFVLIFAATPAFATNIVRNSSFASNGQYWNVNPELVDWSPFDGWATDLIPDYGFRGVAFYQNLNVLIGNPTVVPDQNIHTITLSIYRSYATNGHSVAVYMEYLDEFQQPGQMRLYQLDNESVPEHEWVTVSSDFSLPVGAGSRITRLKFVQEGEGSFYTTNVAVDIHERQLTVGAVPDIVSVSPTAGYYTNTVTLRGTGFGSSTGQLFLAGLTNGLAIQSWLATQVVVRIDDPAMSGQFTMIQDGIESDGNPNFTVLSPYYELVVSDPVTLAIPGQRSRILVEVKMHNGFSQSVHLSLPPTYPGVWHRFSPAEFTSSGGSVLTVEPGVLPIGSNWLDVVASSIGRTDRHAEAALTYSPVSSIQFMSINQITHDRLPLNSLVFTRQLREEVFWVCSDSQGRELSQEGSIYSVGNPSMFLTHLYPYDDEVMGSMKWGNSAVTVLPRTNGNSSLNVTTPDGFSASLPLTSAYELSNSVYSVAITPSVLDNHNNRTYAFSAYSADLGGFGYSFGGACGPVDEAVTHNYTNHSIKVNFTSCVEQASRPGIYAWEFTVGDSDDCAPYLRCAEGLGLVKVNNHPNFGSVETWAVASGDNENRWLFGAGGTLEFVDAGNAAKYVRTDYARDGARMLSSYLPQSHYYIRFVPYDQRQQALWYPNAKSLANAQSVYVPAGTIVTGVDFCIYMRTEFPTVSVSAVQGIISASPIGTGVVLFTRNGTASDYDLSVQYRLSGTAEPGVDYSIDGWDGSDGGSMTIADGMDWATCRIIPNPGAWTNSKTVVINVTTNEWGGSGYIASPTGAVVAIFPQAAQSWDEWQDQYFTQEEQADPLISDPMADPDTNGVANLMEYYLARNPRAGITTPCFTVTPTTIVTTAGSDSFLSAGTLSGTSGQVTGNNAAATKETGEPNHAGTVGGKSIWWKWTAPTSGTLDIGTCDSSFDTVLGIYQGSAVNALTTIASNDDGCAPQSSLTIPVTAGNLYWIAVDGWGGQSGSIVLTWSLASSKTPSTLTPSPMALNGTSGPDMVFSFLRRMAVTNATGNVDVCPDLRAGFWYTGAGYAHTLDIVPTGDGTTEVVRVLIDYPGLSASVRLRVSSP